MDSDEVADLAAEAVEGGAVPAGDGPPRYLFIVGCQLEARWATWFEGLSVTNLPGGEAVISGPIADRAALHGVLAKIRDLNLPLVSVLYLGGA